MTEIKGVIANRIAGMTHRFGRFGAGSIVVLTLVMGGCTILPSSDEVMHSPWKSFEDAHAAYDRIVPNETTLVDLKELGFDPYTTPNISILSYLDIIRQFMPNNSIGLDDLDPAVRACIDARAGCSGYQINPKVVRSERVGNAFLDVLNFDRTTRETGWAFSALVLFRNDVVTYKVWRGTPTIIVERRTANPLGPLQDPAGVIRAQLPF